MPLQILPIAALLASTFFLMAGAGLMGILLPVRGSIEGWSSYQIGAFVALIVAMSNISFFSISAPFWSLLAGALVSLLIEARPTAPEHRAEATPAE